MKKIIKTTVNIEKEVMKDLKIMAFDKDMTQNDLINRYIVEGLNKDKQ